MADRPAPRPERMEIAATPAQRLIEGAWRAVRHRCPYCGGGDVFDSWFDIRKQCPTCGVTYAYETGYFLGSYAVNLVVTELLAAAIVISLIVYTDMSVLQMQIAAVLLAVGMPLLFYPTALLLWVALDVAFHPPDPRTGKRAL